MKLKTKLKNYQNFWGKSSSPTTKDKRWIIPILILIVTLVACADNKANYVHFSGHIDNPKERFVIFGQGDEYIIDTLKLDKNNNFSAKLKLKEGVYNFTHAIELQFVYLKPGAKTSVHFDAYKIDSVKFKGDNADKCQLLVNQQLKHQADDGFFRSYYNKDSKLFKKVYDSVVKVKKDFFNNYTKTHQMTKTFKELLEIATLYNVYTQLELYSIYHLNKDYENKRFTYKEIMENRKNFNLNRDKYMYYHPYYYAAVFTITNDVFLQGYKSYTDEFTSILTRKIGKKIKDNKVRNEALSSMFFNFIVKKDSDEPIFKTAKSLKNVCQNCDLNNKFANLKQAMTYFPKNKFIPNFKVFDEKFNSLYIRDLVKGKKSVILFNNLYFSHQINAIEIGLIKEKYPQLNFVVINEQPLKDSKNFKADHFMYTFEDAKLSFLTKLRVPIMVLVDENGIIQTDFMTLYSRDLIEKIATLLQQNTRK